MLHSPHPVLGMAALAQIVVWTVRTRLALERGAHNRAGVACVASLPDVHLIGSVHAGAIRGVSFVARHDRPTACEMSAPKVLLWAASVIIVVWSPGTAIW